MSSRSFKIPGTAVVHEYLDDEIIIANLDSGIYYSARGLGIPIWELLVAGNTQDSTESLLMERYPSANKELKLSLMQFVEDVCKENLLVESPDGLPALALEQVHYPDEYEPPVLEKYDEMKDLLMLDPVHEVDDQGWPSRSTD